MTEIVLFGVLVGLDNLQATAALGMLPLAAGRRRALVAGFALSEALTPLLGLAAGRLLHGEVAALAEWVGPAVLLCCGALILRMALRGDDASEAVGSWAVVGLPLSLSLDNLLAGVGFGSMGYPVAASALALGAISGAMCFLGLFLGSRVRRWVPERVEALSGAYLLVLGVAAILEG